MKKITLTLCMFAAVFTASARQQGPAVNYSVYSNFNAYPINRAAGNATHAGIAKTFPRWSALTDRLNGTVTTAYGPGIDLPGATTNDKAEWCIDHMLHTFGINKAEWKQISNIAGGSKSYLYYSQVLSGHKVAMSRLSFQFAGNGQLLKIQMKNYGAAAQLTPTIAAKDALNTATNNLPGITISAKQVAASWEWFPIPADNGYILHPSWNFSITGKQAGMPVKLTGYVDGITGKLLYRTNQVKDNFNVTVKGTVYKNGTLNPTSLEALPNINLGIGTNTFNTDDAGFYSSNSLALPLSTTVPLAGLWSTVYKDTTYINPTFTDLVTALGTTYTYPTITPSSSRDVNAYYHVNRVHNFMKGYFPTFTGMDFSLPTFVDVSTGYCNAYYDGSAINFFSAGYGCNSFAEIGDVVYHEYGHGISDHMYTNITGQTIVNGALNEASSDIWGLSITHNPILAQNAYTSIQGFIRRFDMTPQIYPQDIALDLDPHQTGEIIAGTWWDVGVNIGSADTMTKLFTSVYYDAPDGADGDEGQVYQSILVDALMADDNDNDITNGTPHYRQIVAAFARHGIYLEQDVVFNHQELNNAPAGVAIPVSAFVVMTNQAAYQKLFVYYRDHSHTTWDSVAMTTTDNTSFYTKIPAQDTGTIIDYYFAIHDALGVANAYFPAGYNPAIPSYQSTIPYQFGVGVFAMDSAKFETAPTNWSIGSNTGDNATTGKWQRVIPVPNMDTAAWPQADHSGSPNGHCLLTGNGSGNPSTHVGHGATSVLSPVFDISKFNKPVIEYYRWFSNDLSENFKNDPWQVLIKDGSATTWQQVEKTYQSDYNWRKRIFAVSEFLPAGTASIQLKFIASDSVLGTWVDHGQSLTVGGLDDFYLYDAKGKTNGVTNIATAKAKVYPNPADKLVSIILPDNTTIYAITMVDVSGKNVYSAQSKGQDSYNIDVSQFATGIYTLLLQSDNSVQSQKIVVKHN